MRKRLIKQLDFKERQWLYSAVIRMIIADKSVAKEEVEELKETLMLIAGKELKDVKEIIKSPELMAPLRPLNNIKFDHAFIMLTEVARVAAIDSKVVLEEEELIKEIMSLLDFDESSVDKVIGWTKRLALVNKEEENLKDSIRDSYKQ